MLFVLIGISVVLFGYMVVIAFYYRSWQVIPYYAAKAAPPPDVRFSIVVAARNEGANIGELLKSLEQQNYPEDLFEVIVVDDHSADNTVEVVTQFERIKLLSLTDDGINSYKKKAIEKGIEMASNEWIICTDADCIAPPNWLLEFSSLIVEKDPVFIAAPVCLIPGKSKTKQRRQNIIYIFQSLDFLTLQGITGASVYSGTHSMCNGANLAYKRTVFYEVDGFKGVDHIASGDDMLLMHKIWKRYPSQIFYLKSKNAIVHTDAATNWSQFLNQRIRWASKAKRYDDKRIFVVLLWVYLFNFSFLILLVAAFFNILYLYFFIALWFIKTIIEYPFVTAVSRFFKQQWLLRYFFFFQPLHIAYTIVAGFLGSFGKYKWKGRSVQ